MMLLLRAATFTVLITGTITVLVPYVLLHSDLHYAVGIPRMLRVLGLLPLAAGITVYLWCAWDFGASGRGTPAPYDPPRVLVTRGLYAFIRNPIYVGIVSIIFGEALLFDSIAVLGYGALLLALFHLRVLLYEEPRLRRKFSASYDEYCHSVPRWVPPVTKHLEPSI
jgi:protein-S-isoprenylcysteine O-methyltransferase Ste14